jgi:thiamine biosynthesis protein ThiI
VKDQFTLIVRCGEVALKGLNKPYFERMLADRIRKVTKAYEGISVVRSEGLIFVRGGAHHDVEKVMADISKVFGVASISPAMEVESDMEKIGEAEVAFMLDLIERKAVKTFKVEAKRGDKSFPVK